jgi:thiol-disulfide isomerase/thioredoxin
VNTKNLLFFIVILSAVALIGFYLLTQNGDGDESVIVEVKPAPEFILKDYDGNNISFAGLKGKPLVINSWAAWCPFCVRELPDLAVLQEEFVDEIVVVAIDRAESSVTAKEFSDERGVTGRIILLLDPADSFYQSIGGFSMPETLFIDRDGFIQDHKRGVMELDEMRRRVEKIL